MSYDLSNVKLRNCDVSWNSVDLGLLEGDVEFGFKVDTAEVKGHQTGSQVLDHIVTGTNLDSISITLLETSAAQVKSMLAAVGTTVTPDGVGATAVLGGGTDKAGTVLSSLGHKLVFHPRSIASDDFSEDFAFWLATPIPDSIVFAADKPGTMKVSFKIQADFSKREDCNIWVYGDHTQDFAST